MCRRGTSHSSDMAARDAVASTPYDSTKQPESLSAEGVRLEGRGYEQFRNVCAPSFPL